MNRLKTLQKTQYGKNLSLNKHITIEIKSKHKVIPIALTLLALYE